METTYGGHSPHVLRMLAYKTPNCYNYTRLYALYRITYITIGTNLYVYCILTYIITIKIVYPQRLSLSLSLHASFIPSIPPSSTLPTTPHSHLPSSSTIYVRCWWLSRSRLRSYSLWNAQRSHICIVVFFRSICEESWDGVSKENFEADVETLSTSQCLKRQPISGLPSKPKIQRAAEYENEYEIVHTVSVRGWRLEESGGFQVVFGSCR